MALTTTNVTTATRTTSGATLQLTGITAAVGVMLVLACAADNSGASGVSATSATITDAAGNTWTRESETNQTAGAADDGTTLSIWTCTVTNALSSAAIDINFSPNVVAAAAALKQVAPDTGYTVAIIAVGAGASGNGTAISIGPVSVTNGDTIIGIVGLENNSAAAQDSDTTNGTWGVAQTATASVGGATGSQSVRSDRKVVTATGDQTYDSALGAGRDWATNYLILRESAAGDVTISAAGALEMEGAAPSAGPSVNVSLAAAGTAELEGAAPTWAASANRNIVIRVAGAFRLRGYAPTVEPDSSALRWPSALPSPRLETHAFQPRLAIARAEMEQGAARQRRVASGTPAEAPFSLVVNELQMAILDAWVDRYADYGGQWFIIELLTGTGYVDHTVRLMGPPEYKQIRRDRWMATGTFEIEDRPMLSEAELDALLEAAS